MSKEREVEKAPKSLLLKHQWQICLYKYKHLRIFGRQLVPLLIYNIFCCAKKLLAIKGAMQGASSWYFISLAAKLDSLSCCSSPVARTSESSPRIWGLSASWKYRSLYLFY